MDIRARLTKALPGKVLVPGDEQYEASNNSYWTLLASSLQPAYIIQPTSTADVSNAMKVLGPLWEDHQIPFAIRGTGHTPFKGSANIQNGVTMDMQGLKGISLNDDKSVVCISVGETWGTVYSELEKHGLMTGGGRDGTVGVGGLILGGGLTFYSTRRGFACDSVKEFEVVLASGDIVRASEEENHDLWTALKGGLNNFGIVTSIKMKTFESRNMWGGVAFYAPGSFQQLAEALVDFTEKGDDEDTHIIGGIGYGHGFEVVTCCLYHTQGQESPPSLQPFIALPGPIEQRRTFRTDTITNFCKEISEFSGRHVRSLYSTLTVKPDVAFMRNLYEEWKQTLESLNNIEGLRFSMAFYPLTKAMFTNSQKAGGNAKGLHPDDGPLLIILIYPTWSSSEDDVRVHKGVEILLEKVRVHANAKGLLHRYVFPNYAYHKENLFKGYGEEGLAKLRETSQKFDPTGFFQQAVPGGFKLDGGRSL